MNRSGRLRRGLVIVAVVIVGAAACTSSSDEADGAEAGSTSVLIADPENTTSSFETPTDSLAIATDAEDGLLFDVGVISEVVETTATMSIRFDRYQFGGLSGPQLDAEPRYEAATDVGFTNENQRLRTYLLAPEVEVLELEPESFVEACAEPSGEVAFVESSLDSLMSHDFNLVSLSFNDDGEVIRIRDQRGC